MSVNNNFSYVVKFYTDFNIFLQKILYLKFKEIVQPKVYNT